MENFVLYDEIGKANDQIIYKARRKGTIKYLAISCAERKKRPFVSNHVRFVHVLKHPNVVQFHEWYETSNHLWLVMELCTGGSLEQVIKEEGSLPEKVVRKFGADVVRGLEYVHSRGVLFDEMRPSRFLLDGNGTVKLFDFSYAHVENESLEDVLDRFTEEDDFSHTHTLESRNSSVFTAPETFETGTVTVLSDYWGFGCLLYYMCCGCLPFGGSTINRTERTLTQELTLPESVEKKSSALFLSLLTSLLIKSPGKRITSSQLIRHDFWQGSLRDLDASTPTVQLIPNDETLSSNKAVAESEPESVRSIQNTVKRPVELSLPNSDLENEPIEVTQTGELGDSSFPHLGTEVSGIPSEAATFTLHATSGIASSILQSAQNPSLTSAVCDIDGDPDRRPVQWESQARMTQSEYQQTQTVTEDEPADLDADHTDLRFAPRSICVDARSNLAMAFPWGDDAPALPKEPKLLLTIWQYLRGSQSDVTSSEQTLFIQSVACTPLNWRPRPLNDYSRWVRVIPPSKVDGLSETLNDAKLRSANSNQLEAHTAELVSLFSTSSCETQETSTAKSFRYPSFRSPQRSLRSSLLAYLIWFFSSSTASIGRTSMVSLLNQPRLRLLGNASVHNLLAEVARQLKSFSSLTSDVTVSLCQLCGLVLHRVGSVMVQQLTDHSSNSLYEEPSGSFASQLPKCFSSLIEILREPASRTGARVRHAAVVALGELLVCSVCLLRLTALESDPTAIRNGISAEFHSSQWQTAVHHLLRCLTGCPEATTTSTTDTPCGFDPESANKGQSKNVDGNFTSREGIASRLTDIHVRLCAARSVDAFVTAILGCGLHELPSTGSAQSAAALCINSVTTPDVVSHLWSDGLMDANAGHQKAPTVVRYQLHHEISLSCASALAGIVFLNPGLFTSGLIDRIGIAAFVGVLEPPPGGMACQQTGTVTRLLSMAATGLLVPLVSRARHSSGNTHGRKTSERRGSGPLRHQTSVTGYGAGTPAACRRILCDPRFFVSLFRHLKSPHPMLRAKVYLLCSAVLSTCPKESVSVAFDAQLAAFLERDSKSTQAIQTRYLEMQPSKSITVFTTDLSESSCMLYLAATSHYLSDLLATYVVPLICQQLLLALGCISFVNSRIQTSVGARKTSRTNWLIGHGSRPGSILSDSNGSPSNSAVAAPNLAVARTWLPAFNCLPVLLNTCPSIRLRLLMPTRERSDEGRRPSEFCLLSVLGKLLDLWASVDPISSAVIVADVHQSGSVKNHLLGITLTITEDLSQHSELVEARRRDFVCLILPGLARLAVAPKARPETRAICVKIVAKLAETLLANSEYDVSTRSLTDLHRPAHGSRPVSVYESRRHSTGHRPLSADVDLLLQQCNTSSELLDRIHSVSELDPTPGGDLMTQSCYSPKSFNTGSAFSVHADPSVSRIQRSDRKPLAATLGSAVQPPTSDVLMSLFEVVNRLMIPYAELLIQCSELTASTAFIHLLNLLLNTAFIRTHPARVHQPTAEGDCTSDCSEPSIFTAARNLVLSLEERGITVTLVRLFASQLLLPAELANLSATSITTKSHGSVTSSLCLSLFQLVRLLLHWPKEVKPSYLIVELRLLELVFIACLELGALSFPPSPTNTSESVGQRTKKKPSQKRPSAIVTTRLPCTPQSTPMDGPNTVTRPMCAPMLAGLHAMNSLLTYVAGVVRIALDARAAGTPDGESAATAAEELLLASRPPPTLAGLLARLIGLWRPSFKVFTSLSATEPTNSSQMPERTELQVEDDVCSQLCDAALTGLTNLASLFGGEYSRSAMTPSAAASLSLGLLRLHEEDQKSQDSNRSSSLPDECTNHNPPHLPEYFQINKTKLYVHARRRIRLLLRVIRRFVSSDSVCRARLVTEANELGVANLYTTLHFLLQKTQCGSDALTARLIRDIFNHTSVFDRFEVDTNVDDASDRSPFHPTQGISPSTHAVGPTAAA